ncbi:unnamed protein product [Calicophoron daubneyi]|uniref:Uncharacterized protein n=1 Tax=Calicophoron daubneyi TaxID=300641 RepID=A0AAV2TNI1_CALDB
MVLRPPLNFQSCYRTVLLRSSMRMIGSSQALEVTCQSFSVILPTYPFRSSITFSPYPLLSAYATAQCLSESHVWYYYYFFPYFYLNVCFRLLIFVQTGATKLQPECLFVYKCGSTPRMQEEL